MSRDPILGNRHVNICCGPDMPKKPRPSSKSKSKSPPSYYSGGKKNWRQKVVIHRTIPPSQRHEIDEVERKD